MDLNKLRNEIEHLDDDLLELFLQRMAIVEKISDYKIDHHQKIRDPKREEELLKKIPKNHPHSSYLEEFYREIFRISVNYQRERQKSPRYGLLGKNLSHSYSKIIHEEYLNTKYDYFDCKEKEIPKFLKDQSIGGFNVTQPYKTTIISYLDEISDEAKAIGCVNTVIRRNNKLYGYNTDMEGFIYGIKSAGFSMKNKNIVILGNGATSKTVYRALRILGANTIVKLTRNSRIKYKDAHRYSDFDFIINTTPVGMYPRNGKSLIDLNLFPHLEGVIDVIYNPHRTKLLLDAEKKGIKTLDGLPMLVAQAVYASFLFKGTKGISPKSILKKMRCATENLVIVGMPGSGKSSLGRKIARKMNRPFIDTDKEVYKKYGNINHIILNDGVDVFRKYEREIIEEVGKKTGCVIATGGGSVLTKENYEPLKQNGTIFFIERKISYLSKKNRPISQRSNLYEMYKERLPLYRAYADITLTNRSFRHCVDDMIGAFYENICD
ncbi:MAG: shikimate kinase [Tissierellia bacterium]|nr:shikimate kinase [Tissierellia bacterium]